MMTLGKIARLEELDDRPLTSLLDRLGGWPLLNNVWKPIKWEDLYLKLRDEGMGDSSLFYISIKQDKINNTRHILYVRLKSSWAI